MSKKLTLALSFIDDNDKVIVSKRAHATWTVTANDKNHDNKDVREILSDTFTDQLKIDLDKGLMKPLIDRLFEVISCIEKN